MSTSSPYDICGACRNGSHDRCSAKRYPSVPAAACDCTHEENATAHMTDAELTAIEARDDSYESCEFDMRGPVTNEELRALLAEVRRLRALGGT